MIDGHLKNFHNILWMGGMIFSGYIVPTKFLIPFFILNILILASFVVFRRCIIWDLQMKYDKHFNVENDVTCYPNDKTCQAKSATLYYANILTIGIRLGMIRETILLFMLYFMLLGQYHTPVGEDLYKYRH